MLRMNPKVRSSMWEDLQAGRRTAVDYRNGAVIALAESLGMQAPFNRRVFDWVRAAEAGRQPNLTGPAMVKALKGLSARAA